MMSFEVKQTLDQYQNLGFGRLIRAALVGTGLTVGWLWVVLLVPRNAQHGIYFRK